MPRRPRTPSPEEAQLLTVYLDAERYLLATVRDEVAGVADTADAGGDHDARRVAGMRAVRAAVETTIGGLERGAPARVERILGAAAEQGVDDAVRELGAVSGRGARSDVGDTINRGALDRLAATVVGKAQEAHAAILRVVPDAYRTAVARTVSGVLVGAQTRREAAQRAMLDLTNRGLTSFVDRAGRRWRLSSYVEMATRTAAARAHVDAQLDRLAAVGQNLVIVSDAPRECTVCAPWEGQVLTSDPGGATGLVLAEHGLRDGEMLEVAVAGTVAQARAAGLQHPNCRHSLSIFIPGVTKPIVARRDPDGYQAGQRQREIERHIRAWKERETAAIGDLDRRHAAGKVRAWQAAMRDHLRGHPDLKRLPYREGPGAGNAPGRRLREQLGEQGPTPTLVEGRARTPRQMSDPELDRRMRTALAAEDFDAFERLADESDRRDARRAARREQRAAERDRREDERAVEFDRLLSQGYGEEQATAQAYGIPVERQRRDRAIADLRSNGYTGRGFDELSREAYRDYVWQLYSAAEEALGTAMLTPEAKARGVDERDLFTGPESRARKWASPELLAWWDQHGRPILDEYRADLLGDTGAARALRAGRGDFLA